MRRQASAPKPAQTERLSRLFSPADLNQIRLRNRIVHSATLMGLAVEGLPSQRHIDFYAQLARGGAGLIITESMPVHPSGVSLQAEIHGFDPRIVPGLGQIAQAVHDAGAAVIAQLWHCGRQAVSTASGRALWAPSAVPCPINREVPKAMSAEDIAEVIAAFAAAAGYARAAGFDGVEVAAGHGYLIHQFLSPLSNVRHDAYGGNFNNRVRFLFEVLDAIRAACGSRFIVGVRLSADELLPGGFTIADSRHLVERLASREDVDLLSISAGTHASVGPMVGDWSVARGNLVHLAGAVREVAARIPVVAAGRIVDPRQAEEILESGKADLIGISRALLADPLWAEKANDGRIREIRPCIACNECENLLFKGVSVSCVVNPIRPGEPAFDEKPGAKALGRRVAVVGGGPAGLEAARMAAIRGHAVSLFEATDELGGQLRLLSLMPNRKEAGEIIRFLRDELARLGVDVQLRRPIDAAALLQLAPDAVIVATGADAPTPRLPGAGVPVLTVEEALFLGDLPGNHVVLLDAGAHHQRLLAAAEFLASRERTVHVITPAPALGLDVSAISFVGMLERLRRSGAHLLPLTALREIRERAVLLQEVPEGRAWELSDVDRIVVAGSLRPRDHLVNDLRNRLPSTTAVGDCVAPRGIQQAIREGAMAAMAI